MRYVMEISSGLPGVRSAVLPTARGTNRAKKSGLLGGWLHYCSNILLHGWMELSVLAELIVGGFMIV